MEDMIFLYIYSLFYHTIPLCWLIRFPIKFRTGIIESWPYDWKFGFLFYIQELILKRKFQTLRSRPKEIVDRK